MFQEHLFFTMDPTIKADWIAALRSGNYDQGYGCLLQLKGDKRQPCYCCLGVLSQLAANANKCGVTLVDKYNEWGRIARFDSSQELLPHSVRVWAGDHPSDSIMSQGLLPFRDRTSDEILLTDLNDVEQLTFDQLADIIEYFY